MNNYSICASEEEFKNAICNHYHGDYGMFYLTFADNERNIWQCACGYRAVTNKIFNIVVSDLIKEKHNYVTPASVTLIDLPDNPIININGDVIAKQKEAMIDWMTRGNMKHEDK